MNYKAHEYADMFPEISGEDYERFKDDIARNGLRSPIVLSGGKILDGRNRYRACLALGIEPEFVEFEGGDDEQREFVISENINRRHLTESQRAMIAARLCIKGYSSAESSKAMNVSPRSVATARSLLGNEKASNVVPLIDRGEVSLHRAHQFASGDINEAQLKKPSNGGQGRPRGNRHVNALYALLDRLDKMQIHKFELVANWPGDPSRNEQLLKAIEQLSDISSKVQEDTDARASA